MIFVVPNTPPPPIKPHTYRPIDDMLTINILKIMNILLIKWVIKKKNVDKTKLYIEGSVVINNAYTVKDSVVLLQLLSLHA